MIILTVNQASNRGKAKLTNSQEWFEIKTKNSSFKSDSLIYYGRTRDYTVLTYKADTTVLILPNNQIIQELVKN